MKHTHKLFGIIALVTIIFFSTTVNCFAQSGVNAINSADELKAYLDKQPANSPNNPIKIAMKINDQMVGKVNKAIKSAGKYVSLDLSGSPLTNIPDYAFSNEWIEYEGYEACVPLVSIIIPDGVKSIGYMAFYDCENLASVTIPDSVTRIGQGAFLSCHNLTSITFKGRINADNISSGGRIYVGVSPYGHYESFSPSFMGDLKEKYLAGGIGTYIRASDGKWTNKDRPQNSSQVVIENKSADQYYNDGKTAYDKKDYDKAITDFTQAIRLNPNLINAYNYRGLAYYLKSDYDKAIADYTQAIRLNSHPGSYYNRGLAYYDKEDYDKAIADLTQAIRLNPNLVNAYTYRSRAYSSKGDYDKAIVDYTQAIRLDPNNADRYEDRGWLYSNKGDHDKAIADLTQAIRLDSNNAYRYVSRGWAYNSKGDIDKTIADFTQAIRLDPNNAGRYNDRGWAYNSKGDYDKAIADFTQAIRLNPNNAEYKENLEKAQQARGRK